MQFPRLVLVRQKFPDRRIADVAAEVQKQLAGSGFAGRLKPGSRVAIGVGSRGIHSIATIVRGVVQYWKDQGMRPFLFPAMGSHGAASAAGAGGRAGALRHYRGQHGMPGGEPARSGLAGQDRRRHRSLHGQTGLRVRRRHAGGPRQMAHRFRRQDRKRPVQDDGHRAGQVRRRAAISFLRLPAGPGARHPQRGPAGPRSPARFWAAWPFWRTPTTTPASWTRCRWKPWSSARRRTWRW